MLVREAGRLPPPTVSAAKPQSHITSLSCSNLAQKRIEIERSVIPKNGSIVIVDDTLATGETLCAVLQPLGEAGVAMENVSVSVVAEFQLTVDDNCCVNVDLPVSMFEAFSCLTVCST